MQVCSDGRAQTLSCWDHTHQSHDRVMPYLELHSRSCPSHRWDGSGGRRTWRLVWYGRFLTFAGWWRGGRGCLPGPGWCCRRSRRFLRGSGLVLRLLPSSRWWSSGGGGLFRSRPQLAYLAKQAEKILAEVEKCWKGNKNDPHKIAQLNQKAAGIHQELQQLRQACGRIGEADVQLPGSTILQAMQHLIIKAERAAGIKVDLTTNSATGALIRSESFALVEMPARLSAKADQAGPKIEQIMNMVGQANLSEEAKKNNISAKVSDYIQDEQAKEANVDRAQYKR